jgi:hypothetical protein
MGDIATDRRGGTHCALVFLNRDGSTSRPLRQPTALRVPVLRRRLVSRGGKRLGRRAVWSQPATSPEKRREAETCAAVCREVTRTEALPEAVLVDRSDVANQQDGRASGRTASATPFFGLTETARRPRCFPARDRVARLTVARSATNFQTVSLPFWGRLRRALAGVRHI